MSFNPEQPRAPAGTTSGGQWVGSTPDHLKRLGKLFGPVLAEGEQGGYKLRVHAGDRAYYPARIDDPSRSFEGAGRMSIESPAGEIVPAGKWMDWAEKHYPKNYEKLSPRERAKLEVEEQKKYGYAHDFAFHKQAGPPPGSKRRLKR